MRRFAGFISDAGGSIRSMLARSHVLLLAFSAVLGACAPAGDPVAITTGPPSTLQYSTSPARYPYGVQITPNALTAQGSPIQSVSISTVLPDGLEIDPLTGTISGTPVAITPPQEYIITARNSRGSNFVKLLVEITDLPPEMTYSGSTELTWTVDSAINPPITPTLAGGAALGCLAFPDLPAGVTLSPACEISGTPLVGQAETTHLVTAINSGGGSTIEFKITVNDHAPKISYAPSTFNWTRGAAITAVAPVVAAGSGLVTSCSSTPALPAGLVLGSDCSISGTPTEVAAAADYVISPLNVNGVGPDPLDPEIKLNIEVSDVLPALTYADSPFSFGKNTSVGTITPTSSGGTIDSCEAIPALPDGLSLSASCLITGTPKTPANTADYTIRATNQAGSADTTISITVTDLPPRLNYFVTAFTFVAGQAIIPITPAPSGGGSITACNATPALPDGLSIEATSCIITGTPVSGAPQKSYLIVASNSGGTASKTLTIKIEETAPSISFAGSPFQFEKNVAVTPVLATNTGGVIADCAANPGLPSGLALSKACAISGTPTGVLAAADYVITASNSAGTSQATVNIQVKDQSPAITYTGSPYTFTKNAAITTVTPTNSGGPITTCTTAPALPAGLSLANTTCAISGTPTVEAAATNYTITATNSTGSSGTVVRITVNDVAPAISYPASPYSFTKGQATTAAVTNSGGTATNCTSNPALPNGLTLGNDCSVSGTPTDLSVATPYSITGTNSGGSSNAVISIAVKDVAPTLTYNTTVLSFTRDVAIADELPTVGGGSIVSCTSAPALPAGLSVDGTTCKISGTPSQVSAAANYVITATNTGGSATATLNITVSDTLASISYAGSPFTYTKGTALGAPLTPTNTGGSIVSCSATPALPGGLNLSNGCVITGTPLVISGATDYTITATNSAGMASTSINIRVNDIPPVISYAGSPYTRVVGTPLAPLSPTNTGGAVTSCSSEPALPAGIALSSTCVISGTPSAPAAQADYVITAANSGGTADATIRLTVNDIPPNISFAGSPYSYPKNSPLTPLAPTNSGGAVVSCDAVPALPNGLSLAANCAISGTPTDITPAGNYTITATNTGGTSSKVINITVTDAPPAISYAGGPFSYTKDAAIADLSPTSTGGAIVTCNVAPALPAGLALGNDCVISGTPTVLSPAAPYTVTANNDGGSATTTVHLAIIDLPPALDYLPTSYTFNFTRNVAIDPLAPNNTGGPIVSCSISPILPAGLSMNASTCVISGNPVAARSATDYTITATNSGGSNQVMITISVLDQAPAIGYIGSPYTFYKNVVIASKTPTNNGGAIASCSSAPPLPAGLNLSNACVISGTPGALSPAANYTITATNAIGTSQATINIEVLETPPVISYAGTPYKFPKAVAITPVNVTNAGGDIVSCASVPPLPSGVTLSAQCTIGGTPDDITPAADYTITATNSGGTSQTTIRVDFPDTPPSIAYAGGPFVYTRDAAIAPLSVTNTGGAISTCSSAPPLPAGISIANDCAITGTPSARTAAANYVITATNAGGNGQVTINIRVKDIAPSISYAPASYQYTIRETIANVTPTNDGGIITACAAVPDLPTGLSLSSGCVISGTPTAVAAATDHTITATGETGSSAATVNIRVRDLPQIMFYGYTALNGANNGAAPLSKNIWKVATDADGRTSLTANSDAGLDSSQPVTTALGTLIVSASARALDGSTNGTAASSTNIWKSDNAGGAAAALTSNSNASLDSQDVVLSPDGTKIAFASKNATNGLPNGVASNSFNIWIMNVDGSGKTALTTNTSVGLDSFGPVFSPNGATIYFYSKTATDGSTNGTPAGSYNIWKVPAAGGARTALTGNNIAGRDSTLPAVSPDGLTVIYTTKDRVGGAITASTNIWSVPAAGGAKTPLTTNTAANLDSKEAQFSADGTEIVFVSKMNVNAAPANSYNVWKMAANGGSQVALTTNNAANLDCEMPRFSPDDTKIVFVSRMNIGATPALSRNIWIMNENGTSPAPLTSNTNAGLDSFLAWGRIWFQE